MAAFYVEEEFLTGDTIPASITMANLYAADTRKVTVVVRDEGQPIDLVGKRVKLIFRNDKGEVKITRDSGAEPATLTIEDDGTDAKKGRFSFVLIATDTATLNAGAYVIEGGIISDGETPANKTHLLTGSLSILENNL